MKRINKIKIGFGLLLIPFFYVMFMLPTWNEEKSITQEAYAEPDVVDCIRTVEMSPNGGCYEVFGYYDEGFEEYEWRIEVGGVWRIDTDEPYLPSAEELCENYGITLGVDNCMEYVILKEIRELVQQNNQRVDLE